MSTPRCRKLAFPAIAAADAQVLILGSMPGEESLRLQQYYGHGRNAFWAILCELLGVASDKDYTARTAALKEHRIALWDVIAACERQGSLDQAIRLDSVEVNDFAAFFADHADIAHIGFNGGTAEREYRRRVLPGLADRYRGVVCHRLPSTSPAHAGMRFEAKRDAWRVILDWVDG